MQYCRALGYDVLALTELWHNQTKFQSKDKSFVIAEPKIIKKGKRKGKVRFPKDKAAGVAIMLSKRAHTSSIKFWADKRSRGVCCSIRKSFVTLTSRDVDGGTV